MAVSRSFPCRLLVCSRASSPRPRAQGLGARARAQSPRAWGPDPGLRPEARARDQRPDTGCRLQAKTFLAFQDNHIMIIIDLARALALAGLLALVMGSHCNGKHTSKLEPDLFWTGVSFSGFP